MATASSNELEQFLAPSDLSAAKWCLILNENTTVAPEIARALNRRIPQPKIIDLRGGPQKGLRLGSYDRYEQVLDEILAAKPDFVMTANRHGVNQSTPFHLFCELWRIPIVHWYVDNPFFLDYHDYESEMDMIVNIVNCPSWIPGLKKMGGRNVHFLPMASSPDRFEYDPDSPRPIPISFVGDHGEAKRSQFVKTIREQFMGLWPIFKDEIEAYFKDGGSWALDHPGVPTEKYIEIQDCPEFTPRLLADEKTRHMTAFLIDMLASIEMRVRAIKALLPLGVQVWGPDEWLSAVPKAQFHGGIPHSELHEVYKISKLVLNVSRNQSWDVADQRHMDAPLCGAVCVTEDAPGQRAFFDDDECLYYKDPMDLAVKVDELLKDEPRRLAMVEKARAKVLAHHTYDHRVREIEEIVAGTRFPKYKFKYVISAHRDSFERLFNSWIERFLAAGEVSLANRCQESFGDDLCAETMIRIYEGKRPVSDLITLWADDPRGERIQKFLGANHGTGETVA